MGPNYSVIFCDDIRNELGGKVSLMGIYGTHVLVSSMPLTIPRLCIHFNIELPIDIKPERIDIKVIIGGKLHTSLELTELGYDHDLASEMDSFRLMGGTDLLNIECTEQTKVEAIIEIKEQKVYSTSIIIDAKGFESDIE